jgi:hypothetical protein
MSLLNINDERFYIEQDIYEFEDYSFEKNKIKRSNPRKIDIFQAVNLGRTIKGNPYLIEKVKEISEKPIRYLKIP